jgi:sugar (pentulose or hexulose) kinase
MVTRLLDELAQRGWDTSGMSFSFSVRQHDMVLLDKLGAVLLPALSWQCNAASQEVDQLRKQGAEQIVGRVEQRFILPKLMWALRQAPAVRRKLRQVMTTGDWIAWCLTGKARLSTSDAISNALLEQQSKKLAASVIKRAKLNPDWFPAVLQSGKAIGRVTRQHVPGCDDWMTIKQRLHGSTIVAGLGDNHATGVGCGLGERDFHRIVVSAGTSGTINRVCPPRVALAGNAACFEYYRNRLLLMMLADCCKWYDRFVSRYAPEFRDRLDQLDDHIERVDLLNLRRVLHAEGKETYPPDWVDLSAGEKAGSTQLSIMVELLRLVRDMLAETEDFPAEVSHFVLTGGLSQSVFFQQAFFSGVKLLAPQAKVLISARQGPLRYQTAAYGALLNAMRPEDPHAAAKLCPTRSAARPDATTRRYLTYWLRACGL